jgi:two-component system nitrogen regulation response regulator GlnG
MGAILLIENDQNVQGLIKKIFPKEDLMVFNKFRRDPEGAASESAEGQWLKLGSALGLEDAVREYLKMGMGAGKDGNIHEFIIGKVERALIGLILEEEKGNQVRAAKRLGINRNTLRKKMKDLRIIPRVVTR